MIDSYDKMPIGMYFKLQALILANPDEEDWKVTALSMLTGKPEEELLTMPLTEFASLMRRAGFLVTPPAVQRAKPSYKAGAFELVPSMNANKVTAAQFIDFQTFCKEKDDETRCVAVLSCMLVPKGKKYCEGYEAADVREAIRNHISVADALALYGFFLGLLGTSLRLSQTYSDRLIRRMEKMPKTPRRDRTLAETKAKLEELRRQIVSIENGAGSQMWMPFQKLSAVLGMRFGL